MKSDLFHPLIYQWFTERFGEPTEPQRLGWPVIASGQHTLIAAPTGSGKTLAAFMVCIDQLLRQWLDQQWQEEIQVVYVSPLKALGNDIGRNLATPLEEIQAVVQKAGLEPPPIRTAVRSGDTPASQRQAILRRPPQILITTPESLYLLLTSEKGRQRLSSVRTVIVDEIHALARDKRGSHLSLSLERLAQLCQQPPVRIGLSATQSPIEQIAGLLVGKDANVDHGDKLPCQIVDCGHLRQLDVAIEVPPSELSAVCSNEQWAEVYERLTAQIQSHRSTLIFVNTRRLAERVAHYLRQHLGDEAVAGHHGSLAREIRWSVEQRLKSGELKAIVATASLEMGIDIGYIDLVCQIGSPRSIANFLQRVGRSGHSLGATPKGRLYALTRDELMEAMALIRAIRTGTLDAIEIPQQPLDVLAQQVIAEVACQEWSETELFECFRRAWPYRHLTRQQFESVVSMVSQGVTAVSKRGAYLHRDQVNGNLRARRSARLAALTSGGTIPENGEYRVVTEGDKTFVGTVEEDFAIETQSGNVFLLGNTAWRVIFIRNGEVVVQDAHGAPPNVPFWFGEAPGRTVELSRELSQLRQEIAARIQPGNSDPQVDSNGSSDGSETSTTPALPVPTSESIDHTSLAEWLQQTCAVDRWGADQAIGYLEAQQSAIGMVPTQTDIVFERFFDESGGMQLVIHAPLGSRINRAWGLALRKRFCRSFDFELQAAADDNGVVLSLSPQHSFPIENLFSMLGPDNGEYLLKQALLAVPFFQVRWRWNVTRALGVLRFERGKKVPPHLQRFRAEDLLAATFPETVGCLENHHGDVTIPEHPLVDQTVDDCLREAMDIDRFNQLLHDIQTGRIRLVARETREPSPFCHQLLNANPYAFLDDAPLEDRRTRAVATRRILSPGQLQDLGRLDREAIRQVREQAWPLVRDADELHDALVSFVVLADVDVGSWRPWLDQLIAEGRATAFHINRDKVQPNFADNQTQQPARTSIKFWVATERVPVARAVYGAVEFTVPVQLPPHLDQPVEKSDGWVQVVHGRIQHVGPTTSEQLADELCLELGHVNASLQALEGQGAVMQGQFEATADRANPLPPEPPIQWCDRRLLARIHQLTLSGLRQKIQPVAPDDFYRFLLQHHGIQRESQWGGALGVRETVSQLQGFDLPAGTWESRILSVRFRQYDPEWLDQLFATGELTWGRMHRSRPQDAKRTQGNASLTRSVPVSLLLREEMAQMVPRDREDLLSLAGANARLIYETLSERGALFFQDLVAQTGLLVTYLEDGLRELAALGLVTCDSFAAVRAMVQQSRSSNRRASSSRGPRWRVAGGRWSLFPGPLADVNEETQLQHWCQQLLRRYGVVFRELLTRETAAPAWYQLVMVFRRMEMRGEVLGGRFVTGVGGEQYTTQETLQSLRKVRDLPASPDWQILSAADPLNLVGIIDDEPRVPVNHKNALCLQSGRCIARLQADEIQFDPSLTPESMSEIRQALIRFGHTSRNVATAPVH